MRRINSYLQDHNFMPVARKMLKSLCYFVDVIYDEIEAYCEKYIVIDRKQVKEYISGIF